MVPWPCCSHESCCDAFESEGLDKEDSEERAVSPQMLAAIPAYRRKSLATRPFVVEEEAQRVHYRQ